MKILLDTNIIIHREASRIVNQEIGQLFNWLDKLKFTKCVHRLTEEELSRHRDKSVVDTMKVKLSSYHFLKTEAPLDPSVSSLIATVDLSENDRNDSRLLNELLSGRVDYFITEDKKIHDKADKLGILSRVFSIEGFIEFCINNNPDLIDYKVLSVRKEYFGNINLQDEFFDSFREDYPGFDSWFKKKSDNIAYVFRYNGAIGAFLYIKTEDTNENYSDMSPPLPHKKRLKIGTLKVTVNGLRIGERFLKIIFDNAITQKVEEIYVTIFDKRPGQKQLINLLQQFGFIIHGKKKSGDSEELVLVRNLNRNTTNRLQPRLTFPFASRDSDVYFASIYPEYHTELFPDSILRTESADDFEESEPHRNAISKVYISHAPNRTLKTGDVIVFYRTGGYYEGVVTTVAIVESIIDPIKSEEELIKVCQKRTVLSIGQLKEFWNYNPKVRPFVINLLYSYSLPKRPNLKRLIELGVIESTEKMPRGFTKIGWDNLMKLIRG